MRTFFISLLAVLLLFAGCSFFRRVTDETGPASASGDPEPQAPKEETTEDEDPGDAPESQSPEEVAEELMESIGTLDEAKIRELTDAYFAGQPVPDAYYDILMPISKRVTYDIIKSEVQGDRAAVDMKIRSVDAQAAINSILPGAVTHLAAMQLTGKDISDPEQILVEYAAKNIKWDDLPTVETDATLYLARGPDGEWQIDADSPDNLGFINAISGGGIEVAQSIRSIVERFK